MSAVQKIARVGSRRVGWVDAFAAGLLAGLGLSALEGARKPPPPGPSGAAALSRAGPGARSPRKVVARGWREIAVAAAKEFNEDHIPTSAAAVTFYILLSLFPALGAFVSLYGLIARVEDAQRQITALGGFLPGGAVQVLGDQMTRLAAADHGKLGLAFAVSLLISLWSSTSGIKALMEGLNVAYETREGRGFFRLNLAALACTVAAIAVAIVALVVVAAAPEVLHRLGLGHLQILAVLRWPAFFVFTSLLLSVLYRYGPAREPVRWRWATLGGVVAALGWMAMSALFSWYVANFGHYDRTYGSLGAIVGFLTWIWLSLMVVLFGAELNAEIERRA
ncbi:MAG TPA: YihY/virulence factor BrkB family protein [Caulobacteraceae bacterium]|nr:YihY/virulence factor BrkB family protein [Caulobacteraceae bacterium]